MGSVHSEMNCPRCGYDRCTEEYYYKIHEIFVFCPECGYLYEHKIKRDELGEIITKDGTENYKFENIEYEERTVQSYGSYKLYNDIGLKSLGAFENEKDLDDLIENLKSKKTEHSYTKLEVNIYNDGNILKKVAWKRTKSKKRNPILDPYEEEDWDD